MPLEVVTSLRTLFEYAHAVGQAKLAYSAEPNEANQLRLDQAVAKHDQYRDLCLSADRMTGPDLGGL